MEVYCRFGKCKKMSKHEIMISEPAPRRTGLYPTNGIKAPARSGPTKAAPFSTIAYRLKPYTAFEVGTLFP